MWNEIILLNFYFCFYFCFGVVCGTAGTSRNAKGDGPRGKMPSRSIIQNDKRPRGRGRRRKSSRWATYGKAAGQLTRDVTWLMSVVNVEDKYADTGATVALTNAWQSNLLTGLIQGTTSNTRSGQSVKVMGIELRFSLYGATAGSSLSHIILVRDKQANAAAPTFTGVFGVDPTTARVVANLERYVVPIDEVIALSNVGTNVVYRAHIFKEPFHITFNSGNAGTIADIVTNSLYIAFVSDQAVNVATINYTVRVAFVDN